MFDLGLTHIALPVRDINHSIDFYAQYAGMKVVHRRLDPSTATEVVWLSDQTRPFVIVLIGISQEVSPLLPIAHLGVACASQAEVDQLCESARSQGLLRDGPHDQGYPVGYWAFLSDPDGHTLELSYGQEIGIAVQSPVASLIQQAADAWMQADADAFANLFTPEGEFIVPGNRWSGRDTIRQVAADFGQDYTDITIHIHRIVQDNQQAILEWQWQETEKATGKRGSADDVIVIDFQDGKIRRWREYIDRQS
jgi:uncharacterized protein (TIGR02246 family)